MVSLADIGPLRKEVTIRGTKLQVRGITAHDVFALLEAFPELKRVIAQQPITGNIAQSIVEGIPTSIGHVVAAACGESDNPKAIGAAQALTIGEQLEILEAAVELTFPKGSQSFVAGLARLLGQAGVGHGWEAAMSSQEPSKNASVPDTSQIKSGDTPPASLPPGQS